MPVATHRNAESSDMYSPEEYLSALSVPTGDENEHILKKIA